MSHLPVRGTIAASAFLLAVGLAAAADGLTRSVAHGRLETLNGYRVLTVEGTPGEMGRACGELLGPTIRRVVRDMITDGIGREREDYDNMLVGSRIMARHQPAEYLDELRAVARAAAVEYEDLLLLQYFGDVRRCTRGAGSAQLCTSFAVLPPLSRGETCIVGRNFDYFDNGVGEYASLIAHYRPTGRIPFVTVTWAGVINGWTLLNEKGVVASNNTTFGAKSQSLEGISTCFLLRRIAEHADSVAAGLRIIREADRSCGTAMLVASGNPPDAAVVEFDAASLVVRRAEGGFVGAANTCLALNRDGVDDYSGRIGRAFELAREYRGRVALDTRLADGEGVPIDGMNLHCAQLDATALRLRVAMGRIPAYRLPSRAFRLTAKGLVAE